jgi:hypothetical protein
MKQFLINIIIFIVILISLVAGAYLFADISLYQRKQQVLKIRDNVRTVFAGDSNIECAVNDSLISNCINIAQSGEAYLYTYVKIKSLLEYNNQIKTIYLGYSLQNTLKSTEERWLFMDQFVIEKISNYNYLLSKTEKSLIFKKNPKAYLKGLLDSILKNFSALLKSYSSGGINNRIIHFGGYESTFRKKLQDDIKINSFSRKHFEKGLLQEEYLKMISQLCHQKSIRLVLINTPKNKYFSTKFDDETGINWKTICNSLTQDSLLDLSAFSLPDSCYFDMDHLNYTGATKFSEYLNMMLYSNKNYSFQ